GRVGRGRVDHRTEVAAGDRAGDAGDEVLAALDVQDRRLPVGQQVEVVVEVLAADLVAGEPRKQVDVVGRVVVPGRAGEPVPAGREADQVQRPLVEADSLHGDCLAQL